MTWEKVGEIGVDAGIVWLGDPCYILHKSKKDLPASIGKDWSDFCNKLGSADTKSFPYAMGHEGLGVVVSSGYGDGTYPVEIRRNSDGVIREVRIVFDQQEAE